MASSLDYFKWEKKLWAKYNGIFKDASYTITDGVIFPNKYASTPFKVMIMNREVYDTENGSYSLNQEALSTEIEVGIIPFKKQRTMRSHLRQYLSLIHLLAWKNFEGVSEEEAINFVTQSDNEDFVYYLSRAAFINIKKSDGESTSSRINLKEYATKGIEVLKEQIRYFNPSIILGGDVCDDDIDDLFDWGKTLYNEEGYHALKIYELMIDGKAYPFIVMFRPSRTQNYLEEGEYRNISSYYLELFKGIISVEQRFPGYWKKHMNNKCFEFCKINDLKFL